MEAFLIVSEYTTIFCIGIKYLHKLLKILYVPKNVSRETFSRQRSFYDDCQGVL